MYSSCECVKSKRLQELHEIFPLNVTFRSTDSGFVKESQPPYIILLCSTGEKGRAFERGWTGDIQEPSQLRAACNRGNGSLLPDGPPCCLQNF